MTSSNSNIIKRFHLLNVDEDALMHQILGSLFEINGFIVSHADTTEQALSILNFYKVDLMIVNILADSNLGFNLLKVLRHISNTPAIVISPVKDDKFKTYCLELGAINYFHKPVNFDELIYCVKQTLGIGTAL